MKLTILTDNHAGGFFGAEHGLSYLLETDDITLLFDAGHSDLYLRNAYLAGINLVEKVDQVVLSHGHWDHGNGLKYLNNKNLICHPDCFTKRFRKGGDENIGLNFSRAEAEKKFTLACSSESTEIADGIFFLGAIPRLNDFEAKTTAFVLEDGSPDFVPDDSALAIKEGDKFSVISGCAHAGIVNTVEYARKITGSVRLKMVIGGFHLKTRNKQFMETMHYFRENRPKALLASHCTDLPALSGFYEEFKSGWVKTGQIYEF